MRSLRCEGCKQASPERGFTGSVGCGSEALVKAETGLPGAAEHGAGRWGGIRPCVTKQQPKRWWKAGGGPWKGSAGSGSQAEARQGAGGGGGKAAQPARQSSLLPSCQGRVPGAPRLHVFRSVAAAAAATVKRGVVREGRWPGVGAAKCWPRQRVAVMVHATCTCGCLQYSCGTGYRASARGGGGERQRSAHFFLGAACSTAAVQQQVRFGSLWLCGYYADTPRACAPLLLMPSPACTALAHRWPAGGTTALGRRYGAAPHLLLGGGLLLGCRLQGEGRKGSKAVRPPAWLPGHHAPPPHSLAAPQTPHPSCPSPSS